MKTRLFSLLILISFPYLINAQWQVQSTAFNDSLRGLEQISVVNNKVVWAIANDGSGNNAIVQEFTRTLDGGNTWTSGSINGASGLVPTSLFALNADTAWVMCYNPTTDGGKVFRTNDGGQNWVHQSTALFTDSLEAYPNLIYFWNENEGFCAGDPTNGYFEIYTTQNGGALWTRVSSTNVPALIAGEYGYSGFFSAVDNHLWFGTSKGNIYHSNDKGHTWISISNPILNSGKIRVIQFKDSLNGIIGDRASGNTFSLYRTTNGGSSWQTITPNGPVYGRGLSYVNGTTGTLISTSNASGFSGSSISYDFGNTWTLIQGSSGTGFTCLSNFHNQTGWAGLLNQNSTTGGIAKYKILSTDAGISQMLNSSIVCIGSEDLICKVHNYGEGILDSVTINWSVNNVSQMSITTQLNLGAGQSTDINLGSYAFSNTGNEVFKANTTLPNGMTDSYPLNDSLSQTITINPLPIINLGPDTVLNAQQSITLNAGSIYLSYLWSTGDTTQTLMVDFATAGLGQSDYWVKVVDGNGCENSDTISIQFIQTSIQNSNVNSDFQIFPNPSNGKFTIKNNGNLKLKQLLVYDIYGKLIFNENSNFPNSIDLKDASDGFYQLQIITEYGIIRKQIVICR